MAENAKFDTHKNKYIYSILVLALCILGHYGRGPVEYRPLSLLGTTVSPSAALGGIDGGGGLAPKACSAWSKCDPVF